MRDDATGKQYIFRTGSRWLPSRVLEPGETQTFTIELDLDYRNGMTKDWSCTAWGENGGIQVSVLGKAAT